MPKIVEYVYIFVRKDLSKEQIAVQSAHAAMESGIYFGKRNAEPYHFCLLEVENEEALKEVMARIDNESDIAYRAFIEPDIGFQYTALATEPMSKDKGKFFKQYKLLKFKK